MLTPLLIIALSSLGGVLLYLCANPTESWEDWDAVHDFVGEEAEDYDFNEELNDWIRKKELGQ